MNGPRYCRQCGALMGHRKPKVVGFNEDNGKPFYETVYRCPNYRFWNIWHSNVTVSGDPQMKASLGESQE